MTPVVVEPTAGPGLPGSGVEPPGWGCDPEPHAGPDAGPDPVPASRRSERRRRRRTDRWALAVPPFVAAAATWRWFPVDRFLATGDITPFVREGTGSELFSLWNYRTNGAGSTGNAAARLVQVAAIRLVEAVGGSEMLAQHLFYAACVAFAAFGVAYLARALVDDPRVVATAGLLGVFNPFVLVNLPNPLVLFWIGTVATGSGVVVRAATGTPVSGLRLAAATVPASFLSVNPPQIATATLALLAVAGGASLLVGAAGARRVVRLLLRALPWAVVLNLWWLVPMAVSTLSPEGARFAAQTRVVDWGWSHSANSLANVVSLTAYWGWYHPEFAPWAEALDRMPWSWLRWIVPALAAAAPFVTRGRRRRVALVLLATGLVAVVLGKGLHPPFPELNLWLYEHVPGVWLLREPMSKIGGVLLLAEILLVALTLGEVVRRRAAVSRRVGRTVATALGVCVLLALAFPLPLWSGSIGPDGEHGLPSARVRVPDGWRRLGAAVDASATRGKVLQLPLDRYYQVTTTWGYHGADELLAELVDRPVLQLRPDTYYLPGGDTAEILRATERALAAGDTSRASALMRVMGVSLVVVRRDLAAEQLVPPEVSAGAVAAGLSRVPGVGEPERFGVADLYTVPGGELVRTPSEIVGLARRSTADRVTALAALGADRAAVAPGAVPVDRLSWEAYGDDGADAETGFSLRRAGRYDVGLDRDTPHRWAVRVTSDPSGAGGAVSFRDPTTVTVDDHRVAPAPPSRIAVDTSEIAALDLGGTLTPVGSGTSLVPIDEPMEVIAYAPSAPPAGGIRYADPGFCGPRTPDAAVRAERRRTSVRLVASGGLGCTTLPGPAVAPTGVYRVRLETRSPSGDDPRVCVWQAGVGGCLPTGALTATREWTEHEFIVRARPGVTGLTTYLYADGSEERSVVEYRNVVVEPLRVAGRGTVVPARRPPARLRLAAGRHRISVERPRSDRSLSLAYVLGDCAAVDDRTPREAGLAVEPIRGGARLRAEAHSACVTAPLDAAAPGGRYELSLDVRTVSGRSARLCVWQDGPDRCAEITPVPSSGDWSAYRTELRLHPGTAAARVYLYADGPESGVTVTEYRDLRVRPVEPEIVHVDPSVAPADREQPTWRRSGSGTFTATPADRDPTLVVLAESYGPGWSLRGAPEARHVEVYGYANGWYLPQGAPEALTMTFGPGRFVRVGLWISVLGALAAVASAVVARRRRHG